MKKWLVAIFLVAVNSACCQTNFYTRSIDSLIANNEKFFLNYHADSVYQPDPGNSLFLNPVKVKFFFADNKGKKLVKAGESSGSPADSMHVVYYFHNRQLLKIIAHLEKKHFTADQIFYFKNNRFLYPQSYENSPFNQVDFTARAKLYLKFRTKHYEPAE